MSEIEDEIAAEAEALELGKFIRSTLPDMSVPIHPPDIMNPRVIELRRNRQPRAASIGPRYILVDDGSDVLLLDTTHDHYFARCVQIHRPWAEELLRLANRPDTP